MDSIVFPLYAEIGQRCRISDRGGRPSRASSIGTMIFPIGHSAMPASFKCAQAKGIPTNVMANKIAMMR